MRISLLIVRGCCVAARRLPHVDDSQNGPSDDHLMSEARTQNETGEANCRTWRPRYFIRARCGKNLEAKQEEITTAGRSQRGCDIPGLIKVWADLRRATHSGEYCRTLGQNGGHCKDAHLQQARQVR